MSSIEPSKEEFKQEVLATINYLFNDDSSITINPKFRINNSWEGKLKDMRDHYVENIKKNNN